MDVSGQSDIALRGPSNRWLRGWGYLIIHGAFVFGLLLIGITTWKAPEMLPVIPLVLLGGAFGVFLFRHPLLNLGMVICGFVAVVGFKEGFQPEEAVYGMYYLGFLGHWFLTRSFLNGETICRRPEEKVLLLFFVGVTATIPVSILYNAWPSFIFSEWISFTLLGFYWPVREAIEKHPQGLKVVVGSLMFLGAFVLLRNLLEYQSDLANAEELWQIAASRAITNESLLMVPALFAMVLYLRTRPILGRAFFLSMVLGLFAGLILTQSRAYWVAFFLAAGVIFLFTSPREKGRILTIGIVSAVGVGTVAYIVLGDYLMLVILGLVDRFLTLKTAVNADISLINRFLETEGVWRHIKTNPILGHGMGVPYRFYNITYFYSEVKTFVHNGYVSLFFKFGIWGLGMMLYLIARFLYLAIRNWFVKADDWMPRYLSLAIAGAIVALSVTATTANPFYPNDLVFMYACLWGIIGGCRNRLSNGRVGSHQQDGKRGQMEPD